MTNPKMNFDLNTLSALEKHAQAVTDDVNKSHLLTSTPLPRLPRRVRSKDLPADVFKLVCMNPRNTANICKFFGEPLSTVEPVLALLLEEGFIEMQKLSKSSAVWRAVDAGRGRTITAKPAKVEPVEAPAPAAVEPLNVGEWRERKAFAMVRGHIQEVTLTYPASLDEHGAKDPIAAIDEIFKYPMPDMVAAARAEWVRRHPKSPKANPTKIGK